MRYLLIFTSLYLTIAHLILAEGMTAISANIEAQGSSYKVDFGLYDNRVTNTVNNFIQYIEDGDYIEDGNEGDSDLIKNGSIKFVGGVVYPEDPDSTSTGSGSTSYLTLLMLIYYLLVNKYSYLKTSKYIKR